MTTYTAPVEPRAYIRAYDDAALQLSRASKESMAKDLQAAGHLTPLNELMRWSRDELAGACLAAYFPHIQKARDVCREPDGALTLTETEQAVLAALDYANRVQGMEVTLTKVIRRSSLPARTVATAMSGLIGKGAATRICLGVMIYATTAEGRAFLDVHGLGDLVHHERVRALPRRGRGRP